jgi:hypothetical protein
MTTELRKGLPPVPQRMSHLPLDSRGYPIPFFVATLEDGTRDFRIADGYKAVRARQLKLCWVCGEQVGRSHTFVIGPMCAVNRTTSEPGCHLECAEFSVTACPFLTLPRAKRNESGLPEGLPKSLGPEEFAIPRNPGVSCLWTTREWTIFRPPGGVLYRLGEPESVTWWTEKRPATRAEILYSIDTGMPFLRTVADQEGGEAPAALKAAYDRMLKYLPAA